MNLTRAGANPSPVSLIRSPRGAGGRRGRAGGRGDDGARGAAGAMAIAPGNCPACRLGAGRSGTVAQALAIGAAVVDSAPGGAGAPPCGPHSVAPAPRWRRRRDGPGGAGPGAAGRRGWRSLRGELHCLLTAMSPFDLPLENGRARAAIAPGNYTACQSARWWDDGDRTRKLHSLRLPRGIWWRRRWPNCWPVSTASICRAA